MIQSVEKLYDELTNEFTTYKIVQTDGKILDVPHSEANRHYQEILEWVENGGVIVDNGA
jgi:CO dehydrogenase/acetyl-CoA synthase delta subunit